MLVVLWLLEIESYFGSFVFMGSPELGVYQRRENPVQLRGVELRGAGESRQQLKAVSSYPGVNTGGCNCSLVSRLPWGN